MLSLKEYAKSRNISYEAVRQSIKRHSGELTEHVTKQGRTQFLDDIGVSILDKYRNKGNVSVIDSTDQNTAETIDALKNEIILLQKQIIEIQNESKNADRIAIEAQAQVKMITESNEGLKSEIDTLKSEIQSYQRTFFGLYRKIKV